MMSRIPLASAAMATALASAVACTGEPTAPCRAPVVISSEVSAGQENVLSAVVTAQGEAADSARVAFGPPGRLDSTTPWVQFTDELATLPVLGLLPDSRYDVRVVVRSECGAAAGPHMALTTGSLPADLPGYQAGGSAPSTGYVVFAAGHYGLAIDNTGRVVWYHRFEAGPGLNFQAQPNGRYAARIPGMAPGGDWVEVDPLGVVARTLGCVGGFPSRFHDLIGREDGSYWLMCDETREMDLTASGGVSQAKVTGTRVQHVAGDGSLLFDWSPFDHFAIDDLPAADRSGGTVNWTHGNAIDIDAEGNLLLSFRSLNEITKIDGRTGAVVWRIGGLRSNAGLENTPSPPFMRQHGLRATGNRELLLLDNLGENAGSRAERYQVVDGGAAGLTLRQLRSYTPEQSTVAALGGTTQPLPGGRALVAYGNGARVEEYDASGNVVWRLLGNPGYVFRAQRIRSLYTPGVGDPR